MLNYTWLSFTRSRFAFVHHFTIWNCYVWWKYVRNSLFTFISGKNVDKCDNFHRPRQEVPGEGCEALFFARKRCTIKIPGKVKHRTDASMWTWNLKPTVNHQPDYRREESQSSRSFTNMFKATKITWDGGACCRLLPRTHWLDAGGWQGVRFRTWRRRRATLARRRGILLRLLTCRAPKCAYAVASRVKRERG